MNPYELMLIMDPNLGEEKIKQLIAKAEDKIKSLGGEVVKTDNWGSKRIANQFKKPAKMQFAVYVVIFFKAASKMPAELSAYLKVTENIVRYNVYAAKELPPEAPIEEKKEEINIGQP